MKLGCNSGDRESGPSVDDYGDYAVRYAEDCGLSVAAERFKTSVSLDMSTLGSQDTATLTVAPGLLHLELGNFEYGVVTEASALRDDYADDRELIQILVITTQQWLLGNYRSVGLKGVLRRSGRGIRIELPDGDYVELSEKGSRMLQVKHKWFWL